MKVIEQTAEDSRLIGSIGFSKLKISCIIGVEEFERTAEQDIYVDLQVSYDISSCAASDRFESALDYVLLAKVCKRLAQEGKYQLIESYAHKVLEYLHQHYPVKSSKIRVEKPSAIPEASCAFVELEKHS